MGAPTGELRMAMPISTRVDDEDTANSFTPARVLIPVEPKDPVARFKLVHERLHGLRDEPAVTAAGSLAGVVGPPPPPVLVPPPPPHAHTIALDNPDPRGRPAGLCPSRAPLPTHHP